MAAEGQWRGRFPHNDIISLLEVNRPFNLAESTSQDLTFGELLDLVGPSTVRGLRLGYGAAQGLPALREAVAEMCGILPSQVLTTTGAALGLYLLAVELCRPGDEVVLFTPCFPPARDALAGSSVNVRTVPLRFENGYRVDIEAFAASLTPATRLVSLATPQNPSGVATPAETVDRMLAVMAEKAPDAFLYLDETYRSAAYGDNEVQPSNAGRDPRIITGASVSKAFGAPGLRTGWLTVDAPELMERLIIAKMNIVISGSPLDETLAAGLLGKAEAVLAPRRRLLRQALEMVENWQRELSPYVEWVKPDAGALCCVRLSPAHVGPEAVERFWAALPGHELQLASGTWFGEESNVFRLGFGYLPLDRLASALESLTEVIHVVVD